MKLLVTKNKYKASNCYLKVSEDFKDIYAISYDWWYFINTDSVGNIIVNNTRYSPSTSQHQHKVKYILSRLNIGPTLTLSRTYYSLCDIRSAINDEINLLNKEIQMYTKLINKKGTHRKKNEERQTVIKRNTYRIKDLRRFLVENYNKKPYPVNKKELKFHSDSSENLNTYKQYFLKPNGKLKRNEFQSFVQSQLWRWFVPKAPKIDRILQLLDKKQSNLNIVKIILSYEYANDLNNMIPDQDSREYLDLKKFILKHVVKVSTLGMDKIHARLTSLQNRKLRNPREAVKFSIHPKLEKVIDPKLKIIRTDKELRKEGREQNHCIGGKAYIQQCLEGYQALNYKGYTFFLTPDLQITQTYGKYNRPTPSFICEELTELLAAY